MTDTEVETRGPDRSINRPWTQFRNVRRVKGFWVLRVTPVVAMAVPTSAFDSEQTRHFEEFLTARGLLR